ncbi:MAG: L-seryl-tRNA(Sec) selenium transferase [Peptococcaceae bacterium]|jgi:L-seryl-tRNA(Ser) seleniumtransferase|nr:L-seryl-tRNA(Sec) selenium transferase [Peptococcaceae bacterium]
MENGLLKQIPNMNSLLEHSSFEGMERERIKRAAHAYLDELRDSVQSGSSVELPSLDECAAQIIARAEADDIPHLRRLINATGVVLHTNLGRAPLGADLVASLTDIYSGYSNLEYDLATGKRGDRFAHVESLIRDLTGAEAAMVVNNNAAAVILMLSALAKGKRVAISRGELVEIGGAFRVPEIMEQSGAELVEVGTTNRTRLSDYASSIEENGVEVLLKVHTSNYKIVGFTESVSPQELAAFAREKGLPALYDVGSCFLLDPEPLGFSAGESAKDALSSGMDVICFSGDKLLGSAQAGILAGKAEYITCMKKHPLARAFRPDKLTLSALEVALRIYRYPDEAKRRIPTIAMLSAQAGELCGRAETLAHSLRGLFPEWGITVYKTSDETGGGSLPNVALPGWAVAIKPAGLSVEELEARLRHGSLPVILRIHDGMALISPRTLLPGEDEELLAAFLAAFA